MLQLKTITQETELRKPNSAQITASFPQAYCNKTRLITHMENEMNDASSSQAMLHLHKVRNEMTS